MKNAFLLLFVVSFTFASCKKDENDIDKLDFTIKNLASLIGKSQSYIKQASPGSIKESSRDDVLLFDYSEDSQMGTDAFFGYTFTSNKCDDAMLLSSGTFTTLRYMMEFIGGELGFADSYKLAYVDGVDEIEETFSHCDDLWDFIENNNIAEEDIDYIFSKQNYNSLAVIATGDYLYGEFVTSIVILKPNEMKSTSALDERMKEMANRSKMN